MTDKDFMTDRLTKDAGEAFSPARYSLKSGNDVIINPYATYDLFYEITFKVMQKLGVYEDIGTPEDCKKAIEKQIPKKPEEYEDKYYACPVCGNVLLHKWEKYPTKLMSKNNGLPYCLSCGQAIDYGKE